MLLLILSMLACDKPAKAKQQKQTFNQCLSKTRYSYDTKYRHLGSKKGRLELINDCLVKYSSHCKCEHEKCKLGGDDFVYYSKWIRKAENNPNSGVGKDGGLPPFNFDNFKVDTKELLKYIKKRDIVILNNLVSYAKKVSNNEVKTEIRGIMKHKRNTDTPKRKLHNEQLQAYVQFKPGLFAKYDYVNNTFTIYYSQEYEAAKAFVLTDEFDYYMFMGTYYTGQDWSHFLKNLVQIGETQPLFELIR